MKKMILSLCLIGLSLTAGAQENGAFVSAGVGTKLYDKAFRGADVSMQGGYNYKGLDVSAQLDYFSNCWGKDRLAALTYRDDRTGSGASSIMSNSENITALTIRLNLGYDLLHFVHNNWRHHIRPYVGLGYSQLRTSSNYETSDANMRCYELKDQLHSGFEVIIGMAYDFNITRHWALGAYIEGLPMIREHGIMGLRTRYSF